MSVIPELGHMFGQALAQWRAFSFSSHKIFHAAVRFGIMRGNPVITIDM